VRIRPLTPEQAKRSLANRLGRVADNVRQIATKLGARPFRVFLVWTRFPAEVRGEGGPDREVERVELLPTPEVKSLDAVTFSIFHAGTVPAGSVKLLGVSVHRYTFDQLTGKTVPGLGTVDQLPEPWTFFYEVVEDGRGDNPPQRWKFRTLSYPVRLAENAEWTIMLERVSEDRGRDGLSKYLSGREG
jgi:hypothetical protein